MQRSKEEIQRYRQWSTKQYPTNIRLVHTSFTKYRVRPGSDGFEISGHNSIKSRRW